MGDSPVRRRGLIGIRDVGESFRSLVEGEPCGLSIGICDELRFGMMGS
jgi:hypothetical protein